MPSLETLSRAELEAIAEALNRGITLEELGLEPEEFLAPHEAGFNEAFAKKYWNNPAGFVNDCFTWKLNEGPTFYQIDILELLSEYNRAAAYGPHGLGKTALNAWVILWFALTRSAAGADWKVVTTASAWRQLTKFLWPEIHKWSKRLKWNYIGREPFTLHELLKLSLSLPGGEAFAVASSDPALIEGAHADQLLYLFDESKAVAEGTFDAAEGAFSNTNNAAGNEAYALATSTPGEPVGRFYDICSHRAGFEDWKVRHVTLADCIEAGRVSNSWVIQRRKQWGENSAVFLNRVKGEFASSDEDGVIPLAWVEAANLRWLEIEDKKAWPGFSCVGVDIAGEGNDKTVFALKHGDHIKELARYSKEDTMQITGRVAQLLNSKGAGYAILDVIGLGAGVVHRLKEVKAQSKTAWDIVAFNAGESAETKDSSGELEFLNKRAAAWWNLRELLDPANNAQIALPPDDKLTGDLTAPHWKATSAGKIQIEAKDQIKARLGRSTDDGDAVVMAYFKPKKKRTLTSL